MTLRRLAALYAFFVFLFAVVVCRVYLNASNTDYAARAAEQTVTTLKLAARRGNFYDCDGVRMTGQDAAYYALCIPGEENYARLFDCVSYKQQALLYRKRNSAAPFLIEVDTDLTSRGIYTVTGTKRYCAYPLCAHLIGYLDSTGAGVSGLEAAFDERLRGSGAQSYVQCVTNAQGRLMEETTPRFNAADSGCSGVQLTLSLPVQRACEGVAAATMTTGCILVLDTETAKVRACVSMPDYDPENVQKSIEAGDSSLLNRALCAFNVGSVFKPVLAAAALETGNTGLSIDCVGYTTVDDHVYRCAGGVPHGETGLAEALEKSCNCYFVALGQHLGADTVRRFAASLGFGQAVYLAGGLKAAGGCLPDANTLENSGEYTNFCFGQGKLLATPVQIAGMMNTIACGGEYRVPSFLQAVLDEDSGEETETLYRPETRTALKTATAKALQTLLCKVVTDGTGAEAVPEVLTAGGKTGTAQTGRFDADGNEYKNLWFAGFYPGDKPKYTVVVMQDDQTAASHSSAAIFAKVCDALYLLDADLQQETQEAEKTTGAKTSGNAAASKTA